MKEYVKPSLKVLPMRAEQPIAAYGDEIAISVPQGWDFPLFDAEN